MVNNFKHKQFTCNIEVIGSVLIVIKNKTVED